MHFRFAIFTDSGKTKRESLWSNYEKGEPIAVRFFLQDNKDGLEFMLIFIASLEKIMNLLLQFSKKII